MAEVAPKYGEYSDGKFWFERKGSTVTVGLTTSAVDEIGEVEGIELPEEGDDFSKGEVIARIEGAQGVFEITAPASGLVQEINESAKGSPEVVSEDPLEEGWLVKLEVEDTTELKEFVSG